MFESICTSIKLFKEYLDDSFESDSINFNSLPKPPEPQSEEHKLNSDNDEAKQLLQKIKEGISSIRNSEPGMFLHLL